MCYSYGLAIIGMFGNGGSRTKSHKPGEVKHIAPMSESA
jgi:hypothetical protein